MRSWRWAVVAAVVATAGCSSGPRELTSTRAAEVDKEVRAFAKDVASGVTHDGPTAWRRYFSDSPAFFMASEGRLAFTNGASAAAAIPDLARTIRKLQLEWGEELRVDPLTPELAVMATP
jgi:hypothetical protein